MNPMQRHHNPDDQQGRTPLVITSGGGDDPAVRSGGERWVQVAEDGGCVFRGDPMGMPIVYVYCHEGHLFADTNPALLFDYVTAQKLPLEVSPEAISHFLTAGLIPFPQSIFRQVFALGIGDRLHVTRAGGQWLCKHELVFPYFSENSSGDSAPDARHLLTVLTQAVEQRIVNIESPALMLSSGKDSTALAVCLGELGRKDVNALTFVAETDADEDGYAKQVCDRFGFSHTRIAVPRKEPFPPDVLRDFFRKAPLPCADDCQIPYVYAMSCADQASCILDGSGNDVYIGHVPSLNDRRRERLRVHNRWLAHRLERVVPCCTRPAQLLRNEAELCFLLGLLRGREVRRFFPKIVDTEAFWQSAVAPFRDRHIFDFRAVMRGRHYDQGSCVLKAATAAEAFGKQCVFPWCDDAVADYVFNLPESARFDRGGFVNKLLLRDMLRESIQYPDAAIGKRYFQFDRIAFFQANADVVRSEILECPYWDGSESEQLLQALYARLPRNDRVGVALNAWFLLSGWLNHNRWVRS